ncbi:MAG: hypothetical protein AAGF31_07240 [Planctomycetota bacterium]
MNRQPFEPLEIHLNDGDILKVDSPHLIATGKNQPTCILYSDDSDVARYVPYRNISQVITRHPTGA